MWGRSGNLSAYAHRVPGNLMWAAAGLPSCMCLEHTQRRHFKAGRRSSAPVPEGTAFLSAVQGKGDQLASITPSQKRSGHALCGAVGEVGVGGGEQGPVLVSPSSCALRRQSSKPRSELEFHPGRTEGS